MSTSGPAGIGGGGNPKTRNRLGSLGRGGRAWPILGGDGGRLLPAEEGGGRGKVKRSRYC